MKQQIIQLFKERSKGRGSIKFAPDIKVHRTRDIIFIVGMSETNFRNVAPSYKVEFTVGTSNTTTLMSVDMMDARSLAAIYKKLALQ